MNKGRHLLRWACVSTVSIIFVYCTSIYGSGQILESSSRTRADLIKIDSMAAFCKLEKAPVEFLHEAHTKALSKKNIDCAACHSTENGRIFPKFKRLTDSGRIEVMNVYHKGCISCHGEMKVAREKAGPVECDGCHTQKTRYSSSAQPIGFDKSLHFRHSEAEGKKCERCHHQYDEKGKKLFYAKGGEETCRYCHKNEAQNNVKSMRLASHLACINCHRQNLSKKAANGPLECSGCHDPAMQRKIKKMSPVPRMDRNQPDVVMIKTAQKGSGTGVEIQNRMNFVPFDHQAHETYNDTCRVCHHESLKSCNECHTLAGIKEGKGVNLEEAMHRIGTDKSCQGCHDSKVKDKNCAGCHAPMGKADKKKDDSCTRCHMPAVQSPDNEKTLAAAELRSRSFFAGTYHADIPEKVAIKHLSKEYEPVDFPHRKIVNTLVNNIKDNKLAGYFHSREGTVCKGCHHNSPVSKTPPQCGNCHGKTYDEINPLKSGIMGAYHQQCMGCHQEMGIKQPAGCTDCHKKKSNVN